MGLEGAVLVVAPPGAIACAGGGRRGDDRGRPLSAPLLPEGRSLAPRGAVVRSGIGRRDQRLFDEVPPPALLLLLQLLLL